MRNARRSAFVCLLAASLAGGSIIPSAEDSLSRFEFQQSHMGTIARIVLYAPTAAAANDAAAAAFARIAELDSRLSDYRDGSELMAVCRSAGGASVAVSADLFEVLAAAQALAKRSDGAFDVTIGPLTRLWRRARAIGTPPDARDMAAARRLVGYWKMDLSADERTVRFAEPGMLLDLGGIAKGYAADQALRTLADRSARAALVVLGGDVVAGDPPPGTDGWRIEIAPLGLDAGVTAALVTLRNAAISTSGDAEQYLEHKGVRHSHILTPESGRALGGRAGVTVLARDGMTADALATAVAVLGVERGLALVDDTPRAAALFVERTPTGVLAHRSRKWLASLPEGWQAPL